jgi:hypothetical protein
LGRPGVVGAGRFVGIYPIRDKIGVIAAGPNDEIDHERIGGCDARLVRRRQGRRKRAEGAQTTSRRIASLMFVKSTPLARGRNQLMKFYFIEEFAKEIEKSLAEPL